MPGFALTFRLFGMPSELCEATVAGDMFMNRTAIEAALSKNLKLLGLPESWATNRCDAILDALSKHVERWLNVELMEWPAVMAAVAYGADANDPATFLDVWSSNPDALLEVLSSPVIRTRIRQIRKRGTRQQRKSLRTILGRVAAGTSGRPIGRSTSRSGDVALALEVDAAKRHLEPGCEYVRAQRRERRAGHYVEPARLRDLGYSEREIELVTENRDVRSAANQLVAGRHKMKVRVLRARVSRGRKLLTKGNPRGSSR